MKKTLCFFALCLVLTMAAFAQSGDEKQVMAAVETLRKAMVDGSKSALEGIVSDELSYGHSSGKVEGKAAFVGALVSGASDFVKIDLTEQTVKVVGNTAIVRHNLTGESNDGGKPGTVKLGVLLVWQKQSGKWKLLARQAYKL